MNATLIREDLVGLVIDGQYPLLRWLGSSRGSSVFLTEFGDSQKKASIKLIPADFEGAGVRLSAWEAAQELSHPNLVQVFASGRCQLDSEPMLYIVSEFADEVLAGILPDRALTPQEAREMLGPALSALSYLHEKRFVHSHLKPSNIMAVGDKLKLSADRLVFEGNAENLSLGRTVSERTVYDAPETTQGPIGIAADLWSLGATLVEAFAQRPPAWDNNPAQIPVVPESVPQPFAVIARQCLRIDPARRCTIEQINSRLEPPSTHPVTPEQVDKKTIARRRLGVSIGAAAVVLVTITIWAAYEFHHEPSSPTADEQSVFVASPAPAAIPPATTPAASTETQTEIASASPTSPPAPLPPSSSSAAVPSAAPEATPAVAPAPSSSAAPVEPSTPPAPQAQQSLIATPSSGRAIVKGDVSHQVQLDIPASAMKTISGTVKVAIRVSVDATGHVTNADFDSAGPSKYFANKALEAARQFAFQPDEVAGQAVASAWILHFDFKQSGVAVSAEETTP